MGLNSNEKRVLDLIKQDPFLTQAKLAEVLSINRSTLANIVSSLTQKRYLQGRAYIVNELTDIFCIGAMNIDRIFQLKAPLLNYTSNPVNSTITVGGVARNVAENLGRMELSVSLLSLAGSDADFEEIKTVTQPFVNLDHVKTLENHNTSSYTAILGENGQMEVAFADMEICDQMNGEWVSSYQLPIQNCQLIAMDLNLNKSGVQQVIHLAKKQKIPLVVIPVSGPKMNHLPEDLSGITWLVVNQDESEEFFKRKVENENDFLHLAHLWIEKGVENVIITRGTNQLLYVNKAKKNTYFQPPRNPNVIDVTGAGDSFVAGLIYGLKKAYPPNEAIHYGITNSYYTVQSASTVRQNLQAHLFEQERQTIGNCEIH
ncbi:PfkB family carbohydrate kinase [Facklamia miroungae]|nr:PfkB family carbohydrate kinase [Facklamia miroungae]NKZ29938.1 winged helix-turn-helix transcriptional regulator [Facklamia miroungae]